MGLYDGFKDLISLAQKIDNKDLYSNLLEVQQKLLELQEENTNLKAQIKEMQNTTELENRIVRDNVYTVVTLRDDEQAIRYCSACWDKDRKLVQITITRNTINGIEESCRRVNCPICQNKFKTSNNVRW